MRIGIDISQVAHRGTGVGSYVKHLVNTLIGLDDGHEYVLLYCSLRRKLDPKTFQIPPGKKVTIKSIKAPPLLLDMLWNRLHVFPVERLIGDVDVFISSDWVQPPTKAKNVTILYDLIVYTYPEETHNTVSFNLKTLKFSPNIVASQKRRLYWVKKECDVVVCISESTLRDAVDILKIPKEKLRVVYPGI